MSVQLNPLPPFDPNAELGASVAARWKLWLRDFDTFLVASGIRDAKRQKALLLYQAGPKVREIFNQLSDFDGEGDENNFATTKAKLIEYFEPQKNRRYEVYRFRETRQGNQESLDTFHTRLRQISSTCEFEDVDFEIEEQIIIGGRSSRIRRRALRDPTYTLKDMLIDGRRDETSSYQARDIETTHVHTETTHRLQSKSDKKTCNNCGGEWPHKNQCPAQGKTCRKCNKPNHFQSVCRSSKFSKQKQRRPAHSRKTNAAVRPLQHEDNSSDEEYLYTVSNDNDKSSKRSPVVNVVVEGHKFNMILDTGSTINVIDRNTFEKMEGVKLQQTKIKAFPFTSSKPVCFMGKFESTISTKSRYGVATFYVLKERNAGCLLSANTAQELGVITLKLNKLSISETPTKHIDPQIDAIIQRFNKVFEGTGKLKGYSVKLNIDEKAIPRAQPQRRIPFHLRKKVKEAITQLEKEGIIEAVPENAPSQWVSPIVVVPKKDGCVRLCVDMRVPNTAIKRVRYPIPTLNDISIQLNGAKYFSKLDLNQAYHQLPLHIDSRFITTFSTHVGLYRYTCLNYGTNAAMEIFQHVLQETLQGINGVLNIADDIVVFGKTRKEHDLALQNCLQRLHSKCLTLNLKKCNFLQKAIQFYGQIFTEHGTQPDPARISDLRNAPIPTSIKEVRSLLGMANYSAKYIQDFATLTAPLRELTKKNTPFVWQAAQQKAFENIKLALSEAPVMSYFDTNKETFVTVDASPVGVSAILSQATKNSDNYKVVAYASRGLSDTETRYSQTEKEALAIVWAVEHFHLFLYGNEFTLITDHKPLETIYGSSTSKPSARIERWVLRLQPYSFKVQYKAGSENFADYLSRHPSSQQSRKQERIAEEYVNMITSHSVPKAMSLDEIASAVGDSTARIATI